MKAFMVDLRDIRIERDEFEIAQRYRPFRLCHPLRVRTLSLFDKSRDGFHFSLEVALARKIVSGNKPRKVQEELTTQRQRINCSLACVRKDVVLIGAHKRY